MTSLRVQPQVIDRNHVLAHVPYRFGVVNATEACWWLAQPQGQRPGSGPVRGVWPEVDRRRSPGSPVGCHDLQQLGVGALLQIVPVCQHHSCAEQASRGEPVGYAGGLPPTLHSPRNATGSMIQVLFVNALLEFEPTSKAVRQTMLPQSHSQWWAIDPSAHLGRDGLRTWLHADAL